MKTKQFLFNLLSIGLLVILLGLVTVNPLPTYAQGSVSIEVNPPSKTVQVDEIFDVTIQVVAGAQQVDGAEVHLTFDPAFLEVQSLAAGTNLPMTLVPPTFDNGAGTIDYGAGALPPSLPSGTFDLLTITFKALAQTTGTGLTFITTGFPKTDATFQGNSILASVGPGSVVIEPSVIASLVINEIDYDQPGTDDAEFIEIKNVSDQSINLDLYAIELVNGNGGGAAVYQTIDLPNVDLATDGYYVVCGDAANVTNCDLDVSTNTNLIQNDTDAVAIVLSDTVIDTVSYEGDTGAPYTETAGVTPGDNNDDDAIGLSRFPDGIDTDHNDNDFSLRCITPGETNSSADSNCAGPQFGSLTIIKDANPADDTTFNFTSDIPGSSSFSLQDPSGNSITIIEMTPNTYTITETLPINWQLDSAACTGGSDSGSLNGETLSVAVGADEAVTCTFTNTYVQPETGSITLYKTVINDNGGIAGPNDFGLQIGDTPVISGQAVEIPAGQTVAISETGKSGYQFVSITGAQCPAELGGTVTVAAGDDIECTLTNDDIAPQLTVIKEVINDDGGDAEPDDFTMQVSGTNVSSPSFPGDAGGTTVTLDAGSYTVSESGPTGYDATFDGCAGTIGVGESKTCTITNDDIAPTCYALTLSHSGQGSNPVAAPSNSTGCGAGQYVAGEVISLSGAVPVSGWEISGWSGTANDSSTASTNSLTMPASAHSASVIYTPTCYALTLSHSGQGSNPVAAPSNSTGCGAGQYVAGEVISLSGAVPDSGWEISGWSGTADDSSTASSNSLTMPAGAHSASVIYTEILPAQSSIDLEKFTNGHDADTAPGPNIPIGDPVEWTYEIENTGSLPLTAISLVDDPQGTITCDEGVIPDLDPGESFTCTTSNTAIAGQYVNTATVTAKDPDNNSVSDQDQSHYFGIDPTEWAFECTEHRMEVTGVGMGNQTSVINPQSLTLADPNKVNWLLAQMSGRAFLDNGSGVPDQVTFSTDASQTKVLNTANSFTNDFGYTFETTLQPTTVISVEVDGIGSANYLTPRALVLYSNRTMDTDLDTWTSAGRTTNGHVWQGAGVVSHTEVIDMPALPEPRDLTVTAVYIDNNNDSRPIVIEAEAGGVSASATHLTATDGDLLNIVNLTLTDVPTDTDQVTITIHSPKPDNGDSASLVGVNARYVCDNDLDDDTILNNIEGGDDPDGDQLPNYLDVESDGDLILDEVEWNSDATGDGQVDALDRDADQDGIFNFLDLDSDNDGLTDEEEGLADANENGILDFLEAKNPGGEGGAGPIYLPLIIKK